MPNEENPIVVEQSFRAPIASVWEAITNKDQMIQWFFETISDFQPEVGFEERFIVKFEGKEYLHIWKVTEVIPQLRIVYEWRYGGYVGKSFVKWELSELDQGTKLTFTHVGHDTLQGDEAFSRENGVAGWTYFIQESLPNYLAGKE